MKTLYSILCFTFLLSFIACSDKEEISRITDKYKDQIQNKEITIQKLKDTIDSLKMSNKRLFNRLPYSARINKSRIRPEKKNFPFKPFIDKDTELMGISDLNDSVVVEAKYYFTDVFTKNTGLTYQWAQKNSWEIINLENGNTIMDSLYGISEFQNGRAAIMTSPSDIYIIDTLFTVLDSIEHNTVEYNENDAKELRNKFRSEFLPSETYSFIFDYIDHKKLFADSIRYRISISPRGEGSGGLYAQRLKYGMQLLFYPGWESYSYTFKIPYISIDTALLLTLRLHAMKMESISQFNITEDGIEIRYDDGYNGNKLHIQRLDSVYVEISVKSG